MTNPFYAPYFEPYAYAESYPWVAGPEFAYGPYETVGGIGDFTFGPKNISPIGMAKSWGQMFGWVDSPRDPGGEWRLGDLWESDSDSDGRGSGRQPVRPPSRESRHGSPAQPSGGAGGDDSDVDRSHRHRHKKVETDWTTYAWIGAGVLGAGLVIALIIPRGGK